MTEERLQAIEEKLGFGQEIWYAETVRELLAAYREAQERYKADCEAMAHNFRVLMGDRDHAREHAKTAEQAGYRRGVEAAAREAQKEKIATLVCEGTSSGMDAARRTAEAIEQAIRALLSAYSEMEQTGYRNSGALLENV